MKKAFALLLCVVLLMAMAAGCKKKEDKPANTPAPNALTESDFISGLLSRSDLYYYEACGKFKSIADLEVVSKMTTDDATNVSVTGTAISNCVEVELAATLNYILKDNQWVLDTAKVTKKVPTVTAAPELTRIQDTIGNYMSAVGNALAIQDGTDHRLPSFAIKDVKWEMKWDNGAETARLNVSYTSESLTFTGYYTLTFGETGWEYEYKVLEDGYRHIVMHLESLKQAEANK